MGTKEVLLKKYLKIFSFYELMFKGKKKGWGLAGGGGGGNKEFI